MKVSQQKYYGKESKDAICLYWTLGRSGYRWCWASFGCWKEVAGDRSVLIIYRMHLLERMSILLELKKYLLKKMLVLSRFEEHLLQQVVDPFQIQKVFATRSGKSF